MFPIRTLLIAASAAVAVQFIPSVAAASTPERLAAATDAVNSLSHTPDRDIPQDLLQKAHCIVVVPSMKSGAFVIGADYGRGFASCRTGGGWSAPAGVKVEGGAWLPMAARHRGRDAGDERRGMNKLLDQVHARRRGQGGGRAG